MSDRGTASRDEPFRTAVPVAAVRNTAPDSRGAATGPPVGPDHEQTVMHPRDERVRPAPIAVPQTVLDDLHRRLSNTRWAEPVPGTGWDAGADVSYIRELCDYWRDEYDWRAQERSLNRFPLYLCEVDGVDLHFWWVRSGSPDAIPLLLAHGWPGSIVEFQHLIEPLTDPVHHGGEAQDAVDLVIPSLPGYGFGGQPREPGWGLERCARAMHTLMTSLGYDRFGMQGGDWGAMITSKVASMYPESVIGLHLNFGIASSQIDMDDPAQSETPEAREAIARRRHFLQEEWGYWLQQATRPMSVAIAQADSPAGLAAWIVEKFRSWSDWDDHFEESLSKDVLLTNLMFYWAPNSIASSARMYYERRHDNAAYEYPKVEVPTGFAAFPKENLPAIRPWVEARYDLRQFTAMPRGGHFASLEEPELLLADIRSFFRLVR